MVYKRLLRFFSHACVSLIKGQRSCLGSVESDVNGI